MSKNKPILKTKFKEKTVEELLQSSLGDDKCKASGDAVKLSGWLLEVFVLEAAERARSQAHVENTPKIDTEHLEKILPQLLLDFC